MVSSKRKTQKKQEQQGTRSKASLKWLMDFLLSSASYVSGTVWVGKQRQQDWTPALKDFAALKVPEKEEPTVGNPVSNAWDFQLGGL